MSFDPGWGSSGGWVSLPLHRSWQDSPSVVLLLKFEIDSMGPKKAQFGPKIVTILVKCFRRSLLYCLGSYWERREIRGLAWT